MRPTLVRARRAGAGPAGPARIVDATGWPAARWDEVAARSPFGHVFQSHAWGELKRPLAWTPVRAVVEVGGEPVAAIAGLERPVGPHVPGPLGRLRYLYVPRGPILLRPDREAADAALAGVRRLAAERHAGVVTVDPEWIEGGDLAAALGPGGFVPAAREVQVSRTAMVVPVEPDEARQHALLGDSTARNVNKARRGGVAAVRVDLAAASRDRDDALAVFWEFLVATARREGLVLRDRDYQLEQWRGLGDAGLADLWFARRAEAGDGAHGGEGAVGRPIAGVLLLRCGRRLVSHQAGSPDDADLRNTRANHLLQWEILRWAAGAGFLEYDLGGVDTRSAPGIPADRSHPLWNLFEFKQGFGARPEIHVRAHEHAPHAVLGAAWRLARARGR